jgi:hypothetical protein
MQNPSGLGFEIWVSRKDPTAVLPRTDSFLVRPSLDAGVAEGWPQAAGADMGAEFRYAPARKGCVDATGKFAPVGKSSRASLPLVLSGPRFLGYNPRIPKWRVRGATWPSRSCRKQTFLGMSNACRWSRRANKLYQRRRSTSFSIDLKS